MHFFVRARHGRLAEVQSRRRGREKKTNQSFTLSSDRRTAVLLSHHLPHIKATVPFHRTRQQKHLPDTLADATAARCALIRHKLQSGRKPSGTVSYYKNWDSIHHKAALLLPFSALPLFSQLLLPQRSLCSPWTQQWRWMKAEVFIMRAI